MRNGEAKELICTTHGHELREGGSTGGRGCAGWGKIKGGKWDNCYSIISKIYFLKDPQGLLPCKSHPSGGRAPQSRPDP